MYFCFIIIYKQCNKTMFSKKKKTGYKYKYDTLHSIFKQKVSYFEYILFNSIGNYVWGN